MLENPYERKLAVIVSADVANYTRLTELNELEVHNQLRKRLKLVSKYTEYHQGVVLRTHGDGCLCSFDSVINAFKAMLELQQTSSLLNASLPSASQILFRVGIHLSEVIFDDEEPYGNGVNIAVRLQQNAIPGEILVSKDTSKLIPDKHAFNLTKSKQIKLKNITQKIYASKLIGHNIAKTIPQQDSIYKYLFFATSSLASIALIYGMNLFTFDGLKNVVDNRLLEKSSIVESNQTSSFQEHSELGLALESQLNAIASNVDKLNNELINIQSKLNRNNQSIQSKLEHVDITLEEQENMINTLSRASVNNEFMTVNAINDTPEGIQLDYDNYPLLTDNLISKSIDTIDNTNNSDKQTSVNNTYGCLSCVSAPLKQSNNTPAKNTAIIFGNIVGDGAERYLSRINMLRNYMSLKLQDSIKQSEFSEHIDQYTFLENAPDMSNDSEYLQALCKKDSALLIASYDLMINTWYAEGTYLHFYNCSNKRSVSHYEKQLAPTIYNVTKPYLTDDVLLEVNKSVDYMIDKLHLAETQI